MGTPIITVADGSSSITGAGPALTLNGVTVTVAGGAAAAGDSFRVKPLVDAYGALSLAVTRPEDIAAASPVRVAAALSNAGDAFIEGPEITNAAHANLLNPVTLRFNSPATSFDIVNSSTGAVLSAGVAYTPGADIDYNGWRVQISGTPQPNDSFTVEANTSGVADNANALLLAGLQHAGVFDGGGTNFQEAYSEVVADVGSRTRLADVNRTSQEALKQTLEDRRDSFSAVNLDEEAAALIRFQQAYQAAARTITTAQETFLSLVQSF